MWRNSLNFSSKLAHSNSSYSFSFLLRTSPKSSYHGLLGRSSSTTLKSTSAADTVKWSDAGPGIVNFGAHAVSTSAADLSSLAASSLLKAKDVADLAKHYGRCYWELSKARLRKTLFAPHSLIPL